MKPNKIIAIIRNVAPEDAVPIGRAIEKGGIRMIEVAFDHSGNIPFWQTVRMICQIKEELGDQVQIGAGTVLSGELVKMAHDAGASYIVTPNVKTEVIEKSKELGMKCFPGAMTPTEIENAYALGADAVKVFPASVLGARFFRAMKGPLGQIPLIAVGGVNLGNIQEYFRAGAVMAGIGGELIKKEWIQEKKWEEIERLARCYVTETEED